MTDHTNDSTLQRYVDGELPSRVMRGIRAHHETCPGCRAREEDLKALVGRVAALSGSIQPPVDLWLGVAERITAEASQRSSKSRASGISPRSWGRVVGWATAAAAILTLGIGLGRSLPRVTTPPGFVEAPAAATPATLVSADPEYDAAIADLEAILSSMRDDLRPETVATIEQNLRIIDSAIEESREALLDDPANDYLNRHLSGYMQTKLEILRTVTSVASAQI